MARRTLTSQVLVGAGIVLVGLVLLAETTGLYDPQWLLRFVPSLFVVIGVYSLVASGFRNVVGSLLVIVVAGAWQLAALGYLAVSDVVALWPLLIVIFGLSILLGHYRQRAAPTRESYPTTLAMFAGIEKRVTSKSFAGADLTAIFGGAVIDLREAAIEEPPATVNATAVFGGVEIVAPRDWTVEVDVLPLFGGASDERRRESDETRDDGLDLLVTGLALFGGVEVTD